MNSGLSPGDPSLVAAFRSALLHPGTLALIARGGSTSLVPVGARGCCSAAGPVRVLGL